MAFSWTSGDKNTLATSTSIDEIQAALNSLETRIQISLNDLPSHTKGSIITSNLIGEIIKNTDTLDNNNYCRTERTARYDTREAGYLSGVLSSNHGYCSTNCPSNRTSYRTSENEGDKDAYNGGYLSIVCSVYYTTDEAPEYSSVRISEDNSDDGSNPTSNPSGDHSYYGSETHTERDYQ